MPSIIGHTLASVGFGKLFSPQTTGLSFWLLAAYCSLIPDADVLTFYFRIPYLHMFGHRGFSHSILFGVLLGLTVTFLFYRHIPRFSPQWWRYAAFFSLTTISHGVLDAFTNGGHGVAFFAPFNGARYFFPWRPIEVAAIGGLSRFFGPDNWPVLQTELIWIGIPLAIISGVRYWLNRSERLRKVSHLKSTKVG